MNKKPYRLRDARWPDDAPLLRQVRTEVFVVEQEVPEELEWDEEDAMCEHVLALDEDGTPIGTGRLHPSGKIGRMAVLKHWRGYGVGAAILQQLVRRARELGMHECHLNAQTHALPFYAREGFTPYGEEFDEAGMPHRAMTLRLDDAPDPGWDALRELQSWGDNRAAALAVAQAARREIALFSRDLEPMIYDETDFLAAVRALATGSRNARVRILVQDPARIIREGHRLLELSRRLSSFIEIRVPAPEHRDMPETFLVADDRAMLYRPLSSRYEGNAGLDRSPGAREKLRLFDDMWGRSDSHPGLRTLGI